IENMYAAANRILGNIVKVIPSSKVVGDLALHLVAVGADPAEFATTPPPSTCPTPSPASSTANSANRPAAGPNRSGPRPSPVAADTPTVEKADRSQPGHIAAPFGGVVTLTVTAGDKVAPGQAIATIEAMKMEEPSPHRSVAPSAG